MSPGPALSIIVPVVTGDAAVADCLEALRAASQTAAIEVIVLNRRGPGFEAVLHPAFPELKVLQVPAGTSIPAMRRLGFQTAVAPVVAVIEDHVVVPPEWPGRVLGALGSSADVVSGVVDNGATASLVDRTAFLCEYSHLMPPVPPGERPPVAGNNVAYRRSFLEACASSLDDERWEDHLHACLRAAGARVAFDPDIVVTHSRHYRSALEYMKERYWYSRSRTGPRAADAGASRRALMTCASLALPPILLYRIVRRVLLHRGRLDPVVLTFPLLTVFVGVWAVGEAVGWMAGPGDALSRVT